MYICIYVYTHIYIYIYIYTHMMCVYAYMCCVWCDVCIYIYTHVYYNDANNNINKHMLCEYTHTRARARRTR